MTEQLSRTELSTKTENKCRHILLVFYSHIHIKIIIFLLLLLLLFFSGLTSASQTETPRDKLKYIKAQLDC